MEPQYHIVYDEYELDQLLNSEKSHIGDNITLVTNNQMGVKTYKIAEEKKKILKLIRDYDGSYE